MSAVPPQGPGPDSGCLPQAPPGTEVSRVARSSVVLLLENALRLVLVTAISLWMAHVLGPAGFGILNFASAFAALLWVLAAGGTETPVVTQLVGQRGTDGEILTAAMVVRAAWAGLACVLGVCAVVLLRGTASPVTPVTQIICLAVLGAAPLVLDLWFKAQVVAAPSAIVRVSATVVSCAAKALCLVYDLGLYALAWTVVLESVVAAAGVVYVYRRAGGQPFAIRANLAPFRIRQVLDESWPYLLVGFGAIALMKADTLMLGVLTTDGRVGVYALAQKLSEVVCVVPIVAIESAFPVLARRFLADDGGDPRTGQLLFDLSTAAAIAAIVVALLAGPPLIRAIFGSSYAESSSIFMLHAWSCLPLALGAARQKWLSVMGLQRLAVPTTFAALLLGLGLHALLIPAWGVIGAAGASLMAYWFAGHLSSYVFRELRPVARMQTRALFPWARLYRARARSWRMPTAS